jgi:hypothetical protein
MKMRLTMMVIAAGLLGLAGCGKQAPADAPKAKAAASAPETDAETKARELAKLAADAYIFGYPLVTMEMTRRVSTNVVRSDGPRAPMGQFARLRQYPSPDMKTVTAPNADTLYTVAWLDVGKEPWIVDFPDMKGRYYLMPMLDGWTTVFAVPGTRTSGSGAQTYAITGPGWQGTLPPNVKELKSATAMVWVLGRIYSTGTAADYKLVHALQDKVVAVPLSSFGKPFTPAPGTVDASVDMKTPVRDQVNKMDGATYFGLLASLMKDNPPVAADAPMLAEMAKLGLKPGQPFDFSKADPAVQAALTTAPEEGLKRITAWYRLGVSAGDAKVQNGWSYPVIAGTYGTNYIQRAMITYFGLGANLPADAIYPTARTDAPGPPLAGASSYVMHFDKGALPPAEAFWSITMYDDQFFFVPNSLNRQTLSTRDKLKPNADGSIDLYFSNASPGKDKEANWLPAPKGKFVLMMRMYQPREKPPSIIDGTWKVPPVKKES